jgi:hypothetical protein
VQRDINIEQYRKILLQYINVCNQVLAANQDRFPYNRIWQAQEADMQGRSVEFVVVDDMPKASCAVEMNGDRIRLIEEDQNAELIKRLSLFEISAVIQNPEKYIADPSLIDWSWIKSHRSGLS